MRDVNDIRYYLRLGRSDWGSCLSVPDEAVVTLASDWEAGNADVQWQPASAALSLREEAFTFPTPAADNPGTRRPTRRGSG